MKDPAYVRFHARSYSLRRRGGCERNNRISENRLRLYALIAALIVAGIAAVLRLDDGNLWNFLEIVVTVILVQMGSKS